MPFEQIAQNSTAKPQSTTLFSPQAQTPLPKIRVEGMAMTGANGVTYTPEQWFSGQVQTYDPRHPKPPSGSKCDPKQLSPDCSSGGIGPDCDQDSKYGEPRKQECLDQVKEACEEQRKKCLTDCPDNLKLQFNDTWAKKRAAYEKQTEAAGRALAKCRESESFQKLWNEYDWTATQAQWARTCYLALTGKTNANAAKVGVRGSPNTLCQDARAPKAYCFKDDYTDLITRFGATPGQCLSDYNQYSKDADELLKRVHELCPGTEVHDIYKDFCASERDLQTSISHCMENCWDNSKDDCKTTQCYCNTYKCEGPKPPTPTTNNNTTTPATQPNTAANAIQDRKFTATQSVYGIPIELLYGRHFVGGNVLWFGSLVSNTITITESVFDSSTQKFTAKTSERINNYFTFRAGLCAGEVGAITRIWFAQDLIYDVSASAPIVVQNQDRLRIGSLVGGEAQKVQAEEANAIGWGRVPAYRGLASVIIKNLNLSYFTSFPDLRVEVVRQIEDTPPVAQSSAIASVTNTIFKLDFESRRVFVSKGTDIRVLDYDALTTIRDVAVTNPIEIGPLPSVLEYDGNLATVREIVYGDSVSTTDVVNSATFSFLWRYVSEANRGDYVLALMAGANVSFYTVDDLYGTVTLLDTVNSVLGGVATHWGTAWITRPELTTDNPAVSYSMFMLRSTGPHIEIAEFQCNSTDTYFTDLLNTVQAAQLFPSFVLNTVTDLGSSLTIKGVVSSNFDGHLILFLDDSGTQSIVKWHPVNGVVWNVAASDLPVFGKGSPNRHLSTYQFFSYVGASGAAYVLDLSTGTITQTSTGNPMPSGDQVYDDQLGCVTYVSTANKLVRVETDRVQERSTSIGDVVRDVYSRAGYDLSVLDTTDIDGRFIIGYKSGDNLTGFDVLNPLFNVYPTTAFADDKIHFLYGGTATNQTITTGDNQDPFTEKRTINNQNSTGAILDYTSNQTSWPAQQYFSLPDDPFEQRDATTYTFDVVENDDYMRALAELLTFALIESDVEADIILGPKYLAVTPCDMAVFTNTYRIVKASTGTDLSTQFSLKLDSVNKYNELVSLASTLGFSQVNTRGVPEPIPTLLVMPTKSMTPESRDTSSVFYGSGSLTGEFTDGATVSQSADEISTARGPNADEMSTQAIFGRLTTTIAPTGSPFTTDPNASITVKFTDGSLLVPNSTLFIYTTPMLLYRGDVNRIIVGHEIMQYTDYEFIDAVTVKFNGVLRGRYSTERLQSHAAGTPVMLVSTAWTGGIEHSITKKNAPKMASTKPYGAIKRTDATFADGVLTELGAYATTRQDYTPLSFNRSILHPNNKSIYVRQTFRVPIAPVYPVLVDSGDNYSQNGLAVFFLRADYDPTTFDFYRNLTSDYSYIMVRDVENSFTTDTGDVVYGYYWHALEQDVANWDAHTEPLVVVHIATTNDGDETRTAYKFPPGDYARRRSRGLAQVGTY